MPDQDEQTIDLSVATLYTLAGCPQRYEIKGLIGRGGMGMVFQALDQQLSRDVAIKVLLFEGARDPDLQERFLREARALAVLNHPNIVRIFSSGLNEQGNPYNVMEFLEGESLAQELARGPLSADRFCEVFGQVLAGLEHAHQQQIVHRDLKPSNIMRCKLGDGSAIYKIIDFGIARLGMNSEAQGKALTRTDAILGSPAYISPEQCRGEKVDYRCDIYSLGCIMYECVIGKPPFQGDTALETMYKHMTEAPASLTSKKKSPRSAQLARLVSRCLEKKPQDRPQLSEISAEMKQIFVGNTNQIGLFTNQELEGKSRRLMIACGLCAFLVLAVAAGSWLYFHSRAENVPAIKVETDQDKLERDIARLRSRIAKFENPAVTISDPSQRGRYLGDLFSLGRLQLQSTLKQDYVSAEATYSDALKFCESSTGLDPSRRVAGYALRGKAKYKQGKLADSENDFAESLKIIKEEKCSRSVFHDVLLERAVLYVRLRKFSEASNDLDQVLKQLGVTMYSLFQSLDPPGDGRASMIWAVGRELHGMAPQSEAEAVPMLRLSNRIAGLFLRISTRTKETALLLRYSKSLLPKISGNEKLKADTIDLLTRGFKKLQIDEKP